MKFIKILFLVTITTFTCSLPAASSASQEQATDAAASTAPASPAPEASGSVAPTPAPQPGNPSASQQLRNIKNGTTQGISDGANAVTAYFERLGGVFKQDWYALCDRNLITGEPLPKDPNLPPLHKRMLTRVKESGVPTAMATLVTILGSYGFQQWAKTASRRRNKKYAMMFTILSAWYGTCIQRRMHDNLYNFGQSALWDRVALVAIFSFVATLIVSVTTHWGSFDEKDEERTKKHRLSFRKHILWSLEFGVMQACATALGYAFDKLSVAGPTD